jgi:hypothetical protein
VLVLALLLIPAAAVASHQFADVPNSNIFHGDISWMADKGITRGCNPPANTLFCPGSAVRREQMAAFMHRAQTNLGTRYGENFKQGVGLGDDKVRVLVTTNIAAPNDGGAITIKGMATIVPRFSSDQSGLMWAEVNNGGRCNFSGLGTFPAVWNTSPLGIASAVTTGGGGVFAGSHRIDLCAVGFGTTSDVDTELEVIWIAAGPTGSDFADLSKAGDFDIDDLRSRMSARAP